MNVPNKDFSKPVKLAENGRASYPELKPKERKKKTDLREERTQGLFLPSCGKPSNSFLRAVSYIINHHRMLYRNIWKPSIIALFPSCLR